MDIPLEVRSPGGSTLVVSAHHTPIVLSWDNIRMEVDEMAEQTTAQRLRACICGTDGDASTGKKKAILSGVSGFCKPGQLLAVMGSSGAGKTTLLNVLAGREPNFTGELLLNGAKPDKLIRKQTAFVQQADLFYKTLTVREHLMYQATLRMPEEVSQAEKERHVDDALRELGLDKVANTLIGEVGQGGISGGERRRLSFANELLLNPSLLFCDEPTSGLDSFMAESVVEILRRLARAGRTIVCTIHQPSSDVFALFDSLMLLAEGRVAYFGPSAQAVPYFASLRHECPAYCNPADFYIKMLSIIPEKKESSLAQMRGLLDAWAASENCRQITAYVKQPEKHKELADQLGKQAEGKRGDSKGIDAAPVEEGGFITSFWNQFRTLTSRSVTTSSRDPVLTKARLGQSIIIGLIVGLIYLNVGNNQKSVQNRTGVMFFVLINQAMSGVFGVLQVFPLEIPLFKRENKSAMYSPGAFFLSKTVSDVPLQIIFPIFFITVTYWMIGLNPDPARFFMFMFLVVLTSNCAFSLGYMVSTLAPTVQLALAIAPVILLPFLLFGGFFLNVDSIPPYFYWLSYISFFKYGFEALALTEFKGRSVSCADATSYDKCPFKEDTDILRNLSMEHADLGQNIAILFALLVSFRILAFLFLYRRSKERE